MKQLEEDSFTGIASEYPAEMHLECVPFTYRRHENTYYIPAYPRAFVEEVVNIDYDRRTVTAKFVVLITVCLKVNN
jgi:hypothetical protein